MYEQIVCMYIRIKTLTTTLKQGNFSLKCNKDYTILLSKHSFYMYYFLEDTCV